MAAYNEHGIPGCVAKAVEAAGYRPDRSMEAFALEWWEWYTAKAAWYDKVERVGSRRFKVKRHTLHPARRVCREWASAILDDDGTRFSADDRAADGLLAGWVASTRFVPTAQRALERAFAVGTGALALWFEVGADGGTAMRARRYDARMMLPLSWDDDGIAECAFVTRSYHEGRAVHNLQMHVVEDGAYHVVTHLFDGETGREVASGSVIADFDTRSAAPTFAVLRPAADNVYAEGTYMGQSVFADAVDAVKGVDNAFDSMQREIDATKVKVFMDESLFQIVDEHGKKHPVPMSPDNTVVMKVAGDGVGDPMYEVFSPAIRTAELAGALNVALSELGDLTGFGQDYFRYDKSGGLKTATEVSADNSAFMRNIRKHENELRPQLESLLSAVLACQRELNGWPVEGCAVRVDFDDSIIQDTHAEKAMMLNEVAAGVVPRWMYLQRFFGMAEDEAKALAGGGEVPDMGF